MNQNFPQALAYVRQDEGGFVNDPQDPGGATNFGVTQIKYDEWRHAQGLGLQSVTLIAATEVAAIYKSMWDAVSGDQLPGGVDYCVFDFGVNSGPARAVRYLQRALNVVVDGVLGPKTLAAAQALAPKILIGNISTERHDMLEELAGFGHDGKGWGARVDRVEVRAEAMVA